MPDDTSFGQWLKQRRKELHLTQDDLARQVGCACITIQKIEADERRPSVQIAERLAEHLAIEPEARAAFLAAARREGSMELLPSPATPGHPARSPPAPPLLQSARHQLRAPVADFVGRARELDQLLNALRLALAQERGAIISGMQGMGGIGKTELAYLIAHRLRDAFPDAQLVLNLRGSTVTPLTPEQTLQAVIHTLSPQAKLPDDLPALEQHYRTLLHGSRMLILADDARDALQVQALLPPSGSALLISSRQRFTLPGMATVQLEQLRADEAVTLLRAICPRLGTREAELIARACGHLPLALRISGGILHSTPAIPVATYLAQLGDERQRRLALRDPDDPQLDVEASLALSYAQLDDSAQQVFRQLGVFVADFATTLAHAVVVVSSGSAIEATLQLLLRRNLVMYDAEHARWRLHDLLRDLARVLLEAAGEAEAAWWRYARAAVQIAQATHEQYAAGGDGMLAALGRFDAERPHVDAAHTWAATHARTPDGDRLLLDNAVATVYVGGLRYDARRERIPQWECALAAARRLGDRHAEGQALNNLGAIYADLGEIRRALPYYEQALTIARALNDRRREGIALNNLGEVYTALGEARRAIPYHEQALTIFHEIGNRSGERYALVNLGDAYGELAEARHAIRYCEQALTIAREIDDWQDEGYALTSLGNAYTTQGNARRAIESCAVAVTIAHDLGDRRLESYALSYLAHAQAQQGDLACATTVFEQAVALFREVGNRHGEAICNWRFGLALAERGERERAQPLLRAAVAYEQEIGHAKAAEHAALLARLEAGEDLSAELLHPAGQRAVGADAEASPDAALR
jgi:tetratricopeptide (TPR) repeat protein/transcriptional regulator with XRE-family HTH domain